MSPPKKAFCLRGHPTSTPAARNRRGSCKACARDSRVASPSSYQQYIDYVCRTTLRDTFARVPQAEWRPYDPNRICAWPASGYGWPEDEYYLVLLARMRGARSPYWAKR